MLKTKIKKLLLEEKENLEKQIKYYQSEDPYLLEDRDATSTLDDDITENEGHDRIVATQNQLISQLDKVNKALSRLEKGEYGICKKCSRKIPENRLAIMPTADLCISCETNKP